MVTIIKHKKNTIYHVIYIKVFSDVIVYYLKVSTGDFLKTTQNKTSFTRLTRVFGEYFEMKFQEGCVLKYLNLWVFQYPFGFSVDQNDHIMEVFNEWFPTGNFRMFDTPFRTNSTYKN